MERREAIRNMAFLLGGAISASTLSILMDSCNQPSEKQAGKALFNSGQQGLVTEIADSIIPTTTTPGAKAAGVGPFITMMITECYPDESQKIFVKGLEDVENDAESKFNKSFMNLNAEERSHVLKGLVDKTKTMKAEDKKKNKAAKEQETEENKPYFFPLIRELTLLGYFTSEIGATQALEYVAIPGRYNGCTDLKAGQKTWAL